MSQYKKEGLSLDTVNFERPESRLIIQSLIYIKLCAAHWYLMMVANCFPEIPAYIESNASANFSESSADADDCCNTISSFVLSET